MTSANYNLQYAPRDSVYCPNREPAMFGYDETEIDDDVFWNQYGIAYQENDALWRQLGFGGGLMVHSDKQYCWVVTRIKKPSDFIMLTDAVRVKEPFKSVFCFYPLSNTDSGYALATFHDGRNNSAFVDGHVETKDPVEYRDRCKSSGHYYIAGYVNDRNECIDWEQE